MLIWFYSSVKRWDQAGAILCEILALSQHPSFHCTGFRYQTSQLTVRTYEDEEKLPTVAQEILLRQGARAWLLSAVRSPQVFGLGMLLVYIPDYSYSSIYRPAVDKVV